MVFEHDDINRPVVIGGIWSQKDKFPLGDGWLEDGCVVRRALVSRSGMKLVMSDKAGEEWLDICNKDDSIQIRLDQTEKKVIVVSSGDVEVTAEGKVTVENKGDVAVTSKGNVTLEGNKVTIKAQTELSLEGQSKVQIKSPGQASLEGTTTTVKGSGKLGLESTGICEIKGTLVKIN